MTFGHADQGKVTEVPHPPDEQQIRLRQPAAMFIWPAIVIVPQLGTAVLHWLHPARYRPYPEPWLPWFAGIIAVLAVIAGLLNRWFGVTLTSSGAQIHSIHRQTIAWKHVQSISEEWFVGSKRVVLWTDDGRRIPLRAPVTVLGTLGSRWFYRDFHRIGQWWLDHRGLGWRPIAPQSRRPIATSQRIGGG